MHIPTVPTGHLGDQFDHVKHVTGRTLRAIDRIEHQHNQNMHAALVRAEKGKAGKGKVERFEDGSYIDAKGRPHRHDEKSRDPYGGRH